MMPGYEVGYGKPPKHAQFKPGQSGNSKGRPRGVKNLSTELAEELREKILIKEAGSSKSVTKQRAIIKRLMAKAVQGDPKALTTLLNLVLRLLPEKDEPTEAGALSDADHEILAQFEASVRDTSVKGGQKDV